MTAKNRILLILGNLYTSNRVMEEPMDSLKTIQKTFRIFLRLTHAAKILCVVGAVLSGVGALCVMTSYYGGHIFDLFGKPVVIFHPDTNWKQQYVELLAVSIRMIANCILLAFAQDYLKTEQSDGKPFTLAGAKKLKNLGIRCIWIPIVAIVVAVTVAVWLGEEGIGEAGNAFSITTGIILILVSMIFRYGAELEQQLHGKIEN